MVNNLEPMIPHFEAMVFVLLLLGLLTYFLLMASVFLSWIALVFSWRRYRKYRQHAEAHRGGLTEDVFRLVKVVDGEVCSVVPSQDGVMNYIDLEGYKL